MLASTGRVDEREVGAAMTLSVSALLLLAVIVFWLVSKCDLKIVHAATCVLLGFFLAGSSMAPTIEDLVGSLAKTISGFHP